MTRDEIAAKLVELVKQEKDIPDDKLTPEVAARLDQKSRAQPVGGPRVPRRVHGARERGRPGGRARSRGKRRFARCVITIRGPA